MLHVYGVYNQSSALCDWAEGEFLWDQVTREAGSQAAASHQLAPHHLGHVWQLTSVPKEVGTEPIW